MGQIKFGYGCLCDELEKQANDQGYTLGDKAEDFEKIKESITRLMFANILTDTQVDKCFEKLNKKVIKSLKQEGK